MSEPKTQRVLASKVVPNEWAVWFSHGPGTAPFANTIEAVKWTEDGERLCFMLATFNFLFVKPNELMEVIPLRILAGRGAEYQKQVREEHARIIQNRPTKKDELDDLIDKVRKLGPMSDEQRREQAASFAFGQLALTKEWANKSKEELQNLRAQCRQAAGCSNKWTRCEVCGASIMKAFKLCSRCEHEGG